ncbi:uncharacterized protein L201_006332 [Kwoniella dendrophila CBS 6074]|uniref:Uncharacterized protein n=1 Tax=Kwoniella dendrophila CBS 6074 TaxID=1295534 RepID=A0AAX4K2I9_9TREE
MSESKQATEGQQFTTTDPSPSTGIVFYADLLIEKHKHLNDLDEQYWGCTEGSAQNSFVVTTADHESNKANGQRDSKYSIYPFSTIEEADNYARSHGDGQVFPSYWAMRRYLSGTFDRSNSHVAYNNNRDGGNSSFNTTYHTRTQAPSGENR